MTSTDFAVLLAQTAATWYLVGFIWTMQVLHYPLFDRVGRDAFAAYEIEHNRRFGLLLGPGIVLVAVTAVAQVFTRPASTSIIAVVVGEFVLLVVIVVSTHAWRSLHPPC